MAGTWGLLFLLATGLILSEDCSKEHIAASLENRQECKPRPVVVKLPFPNNTDVQQMTPNHVSILKCGGGCHKWGQRCFSTKKQSIRVPVMLAKCGRSTGVCDKTCSHIDIETKGKERVY